MIQDKNPNLLSRIRQAFENGGDRRPPLYQFMYSNYRELAEMFDGARVNWQHLTDSFSDAGFLNAAGGQLKPETVRQVWYRVRKRKGLQQARRPPAVAPVEVLSPPVSAPPRPTITHQSPSVEDPLAEMQAEMNRLSGRT